MASYSNELTLAGVAGPATTRRVVASISQITMLVLVRDECRCNVVYSVIMWVSSFDLREVGVSVGGVVVLMLIYTD